MKRNAALLIIDCVRKDFFEEYAPRLLQMSDLSVERCYAASSWSTPSHASMLTGKLPHQHGVHAHNLNFSGLKTDTFLTDLDHTTVGTSTNLFAGPSFAFDTLFDEFWNASRNGLFMGGMNIEEFSQESSSEGMSKYKEFLSEAYRRGELTRSLGNGLSVKLNDIVEITPGLPRLFDYGADAMIRGSLERLPNKEPFFYFANFMEAHSPYAPSAKYDSSLYDVPRGWSENTKEWEINKEPEEYDKILQGRRDVYAASIDYLDRKVSAFVEQLLDTTDRETVIFITADHGENLAFEGEDFLWGHQGSLSHPLLQVPFAAINLPEKYSDKLEGAPLSHLDLGEIITAVATDEPLDIISRDYIPAERIGYGPSTEPDNFKYWDRAIRCVYDGDTRYEWDSLGNRFKYKFEGNSVEEKIREVAEIPDDAMTLFGSGIEKYKNEVSGESRVEVDEQTEAKLSDLGYL